VSGQRFASVIRLRPEKEAEYRALHAAAWPAVLDALRRANIGNYSIFLRDGLLFSYLEYYGTDYAADTAAIAADEATQRWWQLTDPCQQPVDTAADGEWWAPLEEVFHLD
jgi:L-rhamnose mutarotase